MKRSLSLLVWLFIMTMGLQAQSPDMFNYQAVARSSNGKVIANKNVSFRFSILQASPTGVSIYTETHQILTNEYGVSSLQIGGGNTVSGNFTTIDWAAGPYFLYVELDEKGLSNFIPMGTSQLVSVPYALYAKNSGTPGPKGDKGDPGDLPAGNAVGDQLVWDGSTWVTQSLCEASTYYYLDLDQDGYGGLSAILVPRGCTPPEGYVAQGGDCNDNDPGINPGATEICDGRDNNCNGQIDEGIIPDNNCQTCINGTIIDNSQTWYRDADGDGYGNPNISIVACEQLPVGYVLNSGDCDDQNAEIFPGAPEICDNIDNDCDGLVDEDFDFGSDVNNCGGCGLICQPAPNAMVSCNFGSCTYTCLNGFADFNEDMSDGCEVDLTLSCIINGIVFPNGSTNPDASCLECNTTLSSFSWSPKADGTLCSDNNACTTGDVCFNGTCTPANILECGFTLDENGNPVNCGSCGPENICNNNKCE